MKTRCILLALGVAVLFLAAPAADAVPEYCWDTCDCQSNCGEVCYELGQVTTCGESELGLCVDSPSCAPSNQCSCSNPTYGTSGGDNLYGDAGDDCIDGNGGADTIYGYAGEDDLFGDGGNDTIYGGSGNDCLDGGANSDSLRGGTGSDVCYNGESYVSCND